MNKPLKYSFGGELLTQVEIIQKAYDHAKNYPPEERKAYLRVINQMFSDNSMKSKFQTIFLPSFGVVFLIVILFITYFNPFPSQFQSGTYWVVLCLAASACGALIPGFIEFQYQGFLRAGGALAIFCLMYFFSPDIIGKTNQIKVENIHLFIVREDSSRVDTLDPEFNVNSHETLTKTLTKAINNYFGTNFTAAHYTYYRKDDGKIYSSEACYEVNDYKLLVIPNSIIQHFSNKRQAYLKYNVPTVQK